jgi:hypothetical protein
VPFPAKFKGLLELRAGDVEAPRHACLVYAVCGRETHSCGWHGWALAGVWRDRDPSHDDPHPDLLPGAYEARCPRCGRELVNVNAEAWFLAGPTPWPQASVESAPMTYVEDPDRLLAEEYLPLGLTRTRWSDRKPGADDDHQHCSMCFRAFSDAPYDEQEGMSDGLHRWICLSCWRRIERAADA